MVLQSIQIFYKIRNACNEKVFSLTQNSIKSKPKQKWDAALGKKQYKWV